MGRSIAGIKKLKQQNAIIELSSSVTVQSVDEYTLLVQVLLTDFAVIAKLDDNMYCLPPVVAD